MNALYEKINGEVSRAARLAASKWNGMFDAEDVEQDLWLWIMESPAIQEYLRAGNPAQVSSALSQKANSICSQEQLAFEHFSGQYVYTPAKVRDLLETYYGTDVYNVSAEVMALAEAEMSQTMIENILGGTMSADEKIDLELALSDLVEEHEHYFEALHAQYALDLPVDKRAEQDRRERAIDKLTAIMNRKRSQRENDRTEGPGTKPKNTTNQEEI